MQIIVSFIYFSFFFSAKNKQTVLRIKLVTGGEDRKKTDEKIYLKNIKMFNEIDSCKFITDINWCHFFLLLLRMKKSLKNTDNNSQILYILIICLTTSLIIPQAISWFDYPNFLFVLNMFDLLN